mgnify:CR=1 FL=1
MRPSDSEIARRIRAMITSNIASAGLHIQHVMGSEESPPFSYTIGMTNIGAPELIVFGLPPQAVHGAIMEYFNELRMCHRPKDGHRIQDLWSVTMLLESVENNEAAVYTVQADAYFEDKGKKPTYKQMLWPDQNGKYPHQRGFNPDYKPSQPYIAKRRPRLDDDHSVESFSLH